MSCKQKCDQSPWQACESWMKEASIPGIPAGNTHILRWKKNDRPLFPQYYCWKSYTTTLEPSQLVPESSETNNTPTGVSSGQ